MAKQFLTTLIAELLTGLKIPTNPTDAASKEYVDSVSSRQEFIVVAPANSVTELMRIPVDGILSLVALVDIKPPNVSGESYHVLIKPNGTIVDSTCYAQINNVSYISITYIILGTDLVASVINTDLTNNVVVNIRIL